MRVGARIRQEREALGMTQGQLAAVVGVSVPHISKIENDRDFASPDLLVKIAKSLRIDPDELFLLSGRLPPRTARSMAAHPAEAAAFLRTWKDWR